MAPVVAPRAVIATLAMLWVSLDQRTPQPDNPTHPAEPPGALRVVSPGTC